MANYKEEGLQSLKKLDVKAVTKLLHGLVDNVCKRGHLHYQDYDQTWSLEEWFDLVEAVEGLIKAAIREPLNKDQIYQRLGSLPQEYQSVFMEVINARRSDIHQQLVTDTNLISKSTLKDFDWQIKLAMASDKLSSIQEPLLNLDLDVQNEATTEIHSLELTREDLKNLISSLEGANRAVQQWKT
ncbi:COMM domain-containing protein 8-like isoform X2 [Crassostrea angulata]|uniref:COMM domain-containing protein n=1 Tax=Magallana gigas TaxID=29159 RepID=A0A8W8KMB9_MAGGI|nr:COMM domain-containing protein 8 [Crassostrea gigas]XP_052676084.1 COMM domain-containing protein 8-like isoform X2 [Crassostrea angulata]|eukprot:XP_011442078.1 PREDICTED: COMM domain-containing protein 8 [Crassostrea gigas]